MADSITLTYEDKIALITLNLPKKLNALTQDLYYRLATLLREVAARDDISITILTGTGRYFSAYASPFPSPSPLFTSPPTTQPIILVPSIPLILNSPQRRRRFRQHNPNRHPRSPPQHPPRLRLQQPRSNPRLLHTPQNPHHRAQRPCSRPLRRSNLPLRFHLRHALHIPPHALYIPRSSHRRG